MFIKRILIAAVTLFPLFTIGQGGILIRPARMEFNLSQGKDSTQTLLLKNNLKQKTQFKIYLGDWLRDSIGGHKYMPAGTNDFSCSKWLKLDQEFVELGPGESKTILVRMTIPDNFEAVRQMTWSMIFVENVEETTAPNANQGVQTGVKQIMRMGIHVYETPPNVVAKDMRMLSFENVEGQPNTYRITCRNNGDVQIECKSYLELMNLTTGVKTKIDSPDFPMFPKQTRFVNFDLPESLPRGKYQVIAAVDAGEDIPLEAAQKTIEIK